MNETFALVLARCAGFAFRAPGLAHPDVPPPLRAGLALVMAAIVAPRTAHAPLADAGFILALGLEAAFGAALGTAASMIVDGAYAGGRVLDDAVGLRLAAPGAGLAAGSGFGRLWSLTFVTGYFVLGGYAVALRAFAATFVSLPPGTLIGTAALSRFGVTLPATLIGSALAVAAPALALALVAQVGLALVGRLVPRFGSFTLAVPLVFALAVAATVVALPLLWPASAEVPLLSRLAAAP